MTTENQAPEGGSAPLSALFGDMSAVRTAAAALVDFLPATPMKGIPFHLVSSLRDALARPAHEGALRSAAQKALDYFDNPADGCFSDSDLAALRAALAAQPQVHPDGTVNPTPQTPVECSVCGGLVVGVAPSPAEGEPLRPTIARIVSSYVNSPMLVDELCHALAASQAQPKVTAPDADSDESRQAFSDAADADKNMTRWQVWRHAATWAQKQAVPSPAPGAGATPLSDQLEATRKALGQERTPAYGDALALCRRLEAAQAPAVVAVTEAQIDVIGYQSDGAEDLRSCLDLIGKIAAAEKNGDALSAVMDFRKAQRMAAARAVLAVSNVPVHPMGDAP
jgi:hypothetical protein